MNPVLDLRGVSKRFDGTQALDNVSLELFPGEVHTLLGENGAGKSTLIKIMTGIHQPDVGELRLDGVPLTVANSAQAQLAGIAAIYQEPMVFPDLNVAENIFISHQNRGAVVQWRRLYRDADAILARLGVALDVRSPARGLTLAAQQTVEIAKALSLKTRVLIMDEPTASLSAHEVAQLFKLVRNLRDQGVAILFISHRLEEVFEISDRITIFRDGKRISTGEAREYNVERAIRDMVGREMASFFHKDAVPPGEVILSVRGLSKRGVFEDITFDIRAGEVLGFAGLVGAGRTDVALALFGIAPPDAGDITLLGAPVKIKSPEQATRMGIAYVPEDRRQQGLIMPLSIAGNISLPTLKRYTTRAGLIDFAREAATANEFRQRLTIRSESIAAPAGKLSGGNQQKVVLSKWLNTRPKLLILDEPTRGIDVGAKSEVHAMINDLAREGLAILMISSDLPEVLGMSDRVLVMREGRQMGIYDRADATQEVVMTAAMGQARVAAKRAEAAG
ncbi:MAG: sugar ABC transporter ATP-binding protein [Chloroflexota bacterium]|nr:sugar ABC transporter ATP-binding protein [Chloroflexota bacterium]